MWLWHGRQAGDMEHDSVDTDRPPETAFTDNFDSLTRDTCLGITGDMRGQSLWLHPDFCLTFSLIFCFVFVKVMIWGQSASYAVVTSIGNPFGDFKGSGYQTCLGASKFTRECHLSWTMHQALNLNPLTLLIIDQFLPLKFHIPVRFYSQNYNANSEIARLSAVYVPFSLYCPKFMCPSMWKRSNWIDLCAFWNLNALKD